MEPSSDSSPASILSDKGENLQHPLISVKIADIFGSDNDESSEEENVQENAETFQPLNEESNFDHSNQMGVLLSEERIDDIVIEAEMPRVRPELFFSSKFNSQLPQNNELYFVKLPNFLSVEPRPFDSYTYEDETGNSGDYGNDQDDEENKTRIKLRVENTIRWRFCNPEFNEKFMTFDNSVEDFENLPKESNAKIIKWSDGSMSLQLGSEYFDIYKTQMLTDYNHLFVRQGTGLQGQAIFKEKLSFRPHSTNSVTHRKMTLSLADKCFKTRKSIKVLVGTDKTAKGDPELIKAELYKKEEEKLRAAMKANLFQGAAMNKIKSRISSSFRKSKGDDTFDQLDDPYDPDPSGTSITAIKKSVLQNYQMGVKEGRTKIYSSDSDEEYDSDKKTFKKSSTKIIEDSDED